MKVKGFVFIWVLFMAASLVSAGGYDDSIVQEAAQNAPGGFFGQSFFSYIVDFTDYIPQLAFMMVFSGVGIVGILMLEYFGFHVIDWFFTIFTYCLDLIFSQVSWVLKSEKNTISAAVLLIVFFAIVFGFL